MFFGLRGNLISFQSLNLTKSEDESVGNQYLIRNTPNDLYRVKILGSVVGAYNSLAGRKELK